MILDSGRIFPRFRAALGRMKHKKQRAAVFLIWIEEKSKQSAADEMGVNLKSFYELERTGRSSLPGMKD